MNYHLACGDKHIDGFVNVDIRQTAAADITGNCIGLDFIGDNTTDIIFTNAFLEHMRYSEIEIFLKNAKRALNDSGALCVTGIPDAETYCKAYCDGMIDIALLHGLTHGSPERKVNAEYYDQLHRSIFDTRLLENILSRADWQWVTFLRHGYIEDPADWHLGFICGNGKECEWAELDSVTSKTYGQEIRNVVIRQ